MIVRYPLKEMHGLSARSIDARTAEVREIRNWLEAMVQDSLLYQITFHSSGQAMVIWFDREDDATFFMLRWL